MRGNAGIVILSLTTSVILLSCVFSFQISGQEDTTDYVQLCVDFIEENYPDQTIVRPRFSVDGPDRETGFTYTVYVADLIPGSSPSGDAVTVSIRHDTLNIELGRDQISRDWDEYYEALPDYYKKINSPSRKSIVSGLGYLPTPSDPILKNHSANAMIHFDPVNQNTVIDTVKDMGGSPEYFYDGNEREDDRIRANITLENILILANQSYVSTISFGGVYDYVPTSSGIPFPNPILIVSITILLAVILRVERLRKKSV